MNIEDIKFEHFIEKSPIKLLVGENEFFELEIYAVKKSKFEKYREDAKDPFSLILCGDKSVNFLEGYYDFEYESIGEVELHMSRIIPPGGVKDLNFYQISFS